MDLDTLRATLGDKAKRIEKIGGQVLIQGDCRDIIGALKYDAICCDPPYGISYAHGGGGGKLAQSTKLAKMPIVGDDAAFDPKPFIDRPAILWGGNHFADKLPPTQSWLAWDKRCANYSNDQADCELAWTNLGSPARMFRHVWNGMLRGSESKVARVHPMQKPVALMEWCLGFLPNAEIVLDPFCGSGVVAIACERMGRLSISAEISPDYFEIACKRVDEATRQPRLFAEPKPPAPTQTGFDLD